MRCSLPKGKKPEVAAHVIDPELYELEQEWLLARGREQGDVSAWSSQHVASSSSVPDQAGEQDPNQQTKRFAVVLMSFVRGILYCIIL